MDIDVEKVVECIDKLIELTSTYERVGYLSESNKIELEMGINSILKVLNESSRQKYAYYLAEKKAVKTSNEMIGIYGGLLRWIKNDIELGLVRNLRKRIDETDFVYEFSAKDFDRVQALVNELRDLISKSKDFENDHKRRILKRLEKLQSELHKKMSSLDVLWGLIGDAGVALGKFGKNAKPFTDRIGEIIQIVCRTQAKAENVKGTLPLRLSTGEQTDAYEEESSTKI